MPVYNYQCPDEICECGEVELTHSMSDCDVPHYCLNGHLMRRVVGSPEVFFHGPGFASTDHVARANIGRNPSNQNRYSSDR